MSDVFAPYDSREAAEAQVDQLLVEMERFSFDDPRRALALSEEASGLARRLGYRHGLAYALGYRGAAFFGLSDYEAALPVLHEALALCEALEDEKGCMQVLGTLALVQRSMGDFARALANGFKMLELVRHLGDRELEAWCLQGLGGAYHDLGDHERALTYFQDSLAIFKTLGADGNRVGEARALNGIGTVYQSRGDYAQALTYHRESLARFEAAGNGLGEARALNDLGTIHQHLGDQETALALHRRSLQLREAAGNRQAQSTSLINLGRLFLQRRETAQALEVLERALAIAEAVGSKPRIYQAHQALSEAHEQQGDLAEALRHYKAFQQVKEDVFNDETNARLKNLEVRFGVEKAEREAEIERLRNAELADKNRALARLLEELKTAQAQLVQQEKLASLGALTAGIAHEIKNPLNFVNNFAALAVELADELAAWLAEGQGTPDEARALLEDLKLAADKIHEHGRRADGIVRAMMQHARGDDAGRAAVELNALVAEYVELAYHGMRAQMPGFNTAIACDYDAEVGMVDAVPQELGRVLINLLNNAFYAVHERATATPPCDKESYAPTVCVSTRRRGDEVEVRIEDNGPGIAPEVTTRIFEPFFTTKPAGLGTGLGLSMSYDIVTRGHGGTLTVESEEGQGASFVVQLPLYSSTTTPNVSSRTRFGSSNAKLPDPETSSG